jgi:CMP-N,N'-diacetyllegionaminic acid synthase
MRILALVPARGGSKRLPGKNIRPLGGKPLIVWSIDAARGISEICDILVSTDDTAIAEVSKKAGAFVPWLRPADLASDTASTVDVALHALDWYEAQKGPVDGLILLQPTSPFRSVDSIQRAIAIFKRACGLHAVVSVSSASCHPAWCFRLHGQGMQPFLGWENVNRRSQDLEAAYMLNGSIYLIAPTVLRKTQSLLTTDVQPLVMDDPIESIDIDTELDWSIAANSVDIAEGLSEFRA